jgi:RNA repair, ligase-Pnkp-associating, region of Hen1
VAIARVFGSALSGNSRERPELAATPLPFEAELVCLPCRGGEALLRGLFEPLGYRVEARQHPLDETQPAWGMSRYFNVRLSGGKLPTDLLSHLYVLIPVLDDGKRRRRPSFLDGPGHSRALAAPLQAAPPRPGHLPAPAWVLVSADRASRLLPA